MKLPDYANYWQTVAVNWNWSNANTVFCWRPRVANTILKSKLRCPKTIRWRPYRKFLGPAAIYVYRRLIVLCFCRAHRWANHDSNLPIVLVRFLNGQAKEIGRQCVEAPLRIKQNAQPFVPRASLLKALGFICEATQDFYRELCPICGERCLPATACEVMTNDTHDAYIERVFCGHLFHQGCLKKYMREPPFPVGGKLCPARKRHPRSDVGRGAVKSANCSKMQMQKSRNGSTASDDNMRCSIRLSHDRWGLNVKLAEARWAQQQARERELEEVKDFLQ